MLVRLREEKEGKSRRAFFQKLKRREKNGLHYGKLENKLMFGKNRSCWSTKIINTDGAYYIVFYCSIWSKTP